MMGGSKNEVIKGILKFLGLQRKLNKIIDKRLKLLEKNGRRK